MTQHVPMRTCIGCRRVRAKKELIRIVRRPDGTAAADRKGKAAGRGAYICPDPACLEKALRLKTLQRALECPVSREDAQRLREELSEAVTAAGTPLQEDAPAVQPAGSGRSGQPNRRGGVRPAGDGAGDAPGRKESAL